jgi:hypothetical protein
MTGLAREVGDLVHDQRSEVRFSHPGSNGGEKRRRESGWEGEEDVGGVESLIPRLPFLTGIGMAAVVGLSGMVENEDRSIGEGSGGEGNGPQQLDRKDKDPAKRVSREKGKLRMRGKKNRSRKWLNGPKLSDWGRKTEVSSVQLLCGSFQKGQRQKRQRTGSVWPWNWRIPHSI